MTEAIRARIHHLGVGTEGDTPDEKRCTAVAAWSAMIGPMVLARIVDDEKLSKEILRETRAPLPTAQLLGSTSRRLAASVGKRHMACVRFWRRNGQRAHASWRARHSHALSGRHRNDVRFPEPEMPDAVSGIFTIRARTASRIQFAMHGHDQSRCEPEDVAWAAPFHRTSINPGPPKELQLS
jgi:hypothetical protein